MDERGFQELEHTADRALQVFGHDLKELFVNAARGMFSLIADLDTITPTRAHRVELQAPDLEMLLVDWLNELLFMHETNGEIYVQFDIEHLSPTELRATVRGESAPATKAFIKAATFHNLRIARTEEGYTTVVVFDT